MALPACTPVRLDHGGEAVAEEICQHRDGRELHELEEHEDGHGGEGALVLIEAEADGVRRVDDEGNGGDAQDAEEEELQREEQRLPLHRAVQLAEGEEEVGRELRDHPPITEIERADHAQQHDGRGTPRRTRPPRRSAWRQGVGAYSPAASG